MNVETIPKGCPICYSDVKGNDKYLFYCKSCNVLYRRVDCNKDQAKGRVETKKQTPDVKPEKPEMKREVRKEVQKAPEKEHIRLEEPSENIESSEESDLDKISNLFG